MWQDDNGTRWPTREPGDGSVQLVDAKYINALEDALTNLHAVQNGPPLIRETAAWEAAMNEAERLLGLTSRRDAS